MRSVKFFLSFLKNALLFSIFALSLILKNAMKPLEHSTSCFRLPRLARVSLGDVLRRLFCRFASLRGTKQSRDSVHGLDCFVVPPRKDAKRVWERSPEKLAPSVQIRSFGCKIISVQSVKSVVKQPILKCGMWNDEIFESEILKSEI